MPVVDTLAGEYEGKVDFVAVAYASSFDRTAAGAARLMPSGAIRWGLDENESVRALYGISGQPWTVLISASGEEVARWAGTKSEDELRASLDQLINS